MEARIEGFVPVKVLDIAQVVGDAFQIVAIQQLFVLEIIKLTSELCRDIKILHAEPEGHHLADVIIVSVQPNVLHKIVQLVIVEIGSDQVSRVVGADHVAVAVIHIGGPNSCLHQEDTCTLVSLI